MIVTSSSALIALRRERSTASASKNWLSKTKCEVPQADEQNELRRPHCVFSFSANLVPSGLTCSAIVVPHHPMLSGRYSYDMICERLCIRFSKAKIRCNLLNDYNWQLLTRT
jgi:hypothetical protein